MIVATPNRGAIVREHDAADLTDLYQLRRCWRVRGASGREAITGEELDRLDASCDRFDVIADDDIRELVKENLCFTTSSSGLPGASGCARWCRR